MARYKLVKKRNRLSPLKDGQWYAEPVPRQKITSGELCRMATQHVTLSKGEMAMALEQLSERLPLLLAQGFTVELGRLGTLRLEYGSEGVREPEDFHPRLMRPARVVFRPSRQLMQEVRAALFYEPGGIVAEGIAFDSVADYRRWQAGRQEGAGVEP